MVELSWRTGDLDQVRKNKALPSEQNLQAEKYLKLASDRSARATLDAGYNYCKALFEWFVYLSKEHIIPAQVHW